MLVAGDEQMVNKVRIVFTNTEGAAGSLETLTEWFEIFGSVLEVEVIGSTGSRVYADAASPRGAL